MRNVLKRILTWLRDVEPAWFNSIKTLLLSGLVLLGINIGPGVEADINLWFGVASVLVTQVQFILTRYGVFSPATVDTIIGQSQNTTVKGEHRRLRGTSEQL